jgi:hypothetical protein
MTRIEPAGDSGSGQRHCAARIAVRSRRPARSHCGMTRAELLALPVTVDIATAARALGLGRSTCYELARRGAFPCRVLRVGCSYRVPTADLLRVLGIVNEHPPQPTMP